MPERASEHVSETVTFELFQPNAFAAGLPLPAIVGFVLSSLIGTLPVPVFPSRSVAVAVFVVPSVSAVTVSVAGVGPLATPEPASVADQVIVTSLLRHPPALSAGETVGVTTGPVLSSTYEACIEPSLPVHFCWLSLKFLFASAVTV